MSATVRERDILDSMQSSSTSARAPLVGQTMTITPSPGFRKDRVLVCLYFSQNIQEGDHVRVPTTHVEPGSSFIGPNLPDPMKGPWPSAGGYKYPLLQEGQVFIDHTPTYFLPAHSVSHFIIGVSCRYPHLIQIQFEPAVTVQF